MKTGIILSMLILSSLLLCSCSDDTSVSITSGETNLLLNPSFEVNANPTLQSWTTNDYPAIKYSGDVPTGGGYWSITIEAVWGTPIYVRTTVLASEGRHIYKFSFMAKTQGSGGNASLIFVHVRNDSLRKQIQVADSTWTSYSLLDTLTISRGDSIAVKLSGGFSQILYGKTFFDLCKLEKLN